MLIESDFESDGYMFSHTNTEKKENVSESVRHEIRQAALDTSTNNRANILSRFTQSMSYSEDGYYGTLALDANSLVTQVSGYGTRNVPVSKTKEHKNLMFNDPSVVPQAITEDGVTLMLTGIDWVVTGTALAGDSLVPAEYKAIASYSGTQQVSYVLGYTTTVNYTGIVTKKTVDSINFTITYTGTPVPATAAEPPPTAAVPEEAVDSTDKITMEDELSEEVEGETESGETEGTSNSGWILTAGVILCLIAASAFGAVYYFKYIKRKHLKMEVYNLIDNDYTLLGVEILPETDITVDLSKYGESAQSASFGFGLDKYTVEKLNGSNISIIYKEETFVHTVDKKENLKEYLFKFVFGEYF
jgi:hypothetical protein